MKEERRVADWDGERKEKEPGEEGKEEEGVEEGGVDIRRRES